jgi:hypothetical protein
MAASRRPNRLRSGAAVVGSRSGPGAEGLERGSELYIAGDIS